MDDRTLRFFHAPQTRSTGVLILLEELGIDYDMVLINHKAGETRGDDYLAVNPMGKVPAIVHGDALVTEQAAIYTYLADFYGDKGLAPSLTHPDRGPFLRWMIFYGSCFEPAIVDHSQKRGPVSPGFLPYGDFETMRQTLVDQLEKGPYLCGETYYAVDTLWGVALAWITQFGLLETTPAMSAYIERVNERPAINRGRQKDAALLQSQAAEE